MEMIIESVLFVITFVLELLLGGGLIISLFVPKNRLWPPPQKGSWQYWYVHFLTESSIFCYLILGFLNWNTFFLTNSLRFFFASILMIPGAAIFLWALQTLTVDSSLGLK